MNLKDSKLPWQHTNVTSCAHKDHVQSAVQQYCNICCDLLLVCGVASWLADVSWWTQRKSHRLHSFQLSVPWHHIITAWRLYCCLCSSSGVIRDNPSTHLNKHLPSSRTDAMLHPLQYRIIIFFSRWKKEKDVIWLIWTHQVRHVSVVKNQCQMLLHTWKWPHLN